MTDQFLSKSISRRQFGVGAATLAASTFLPMRSLVARAQGATDFSGLGYPELSITITDNGYEGVPETTVAGLICTG